MINRAFTWLASTRPGSRYVTPRIVQRADRALTITVDTGNCGPGHHLARTAVARYGAAAAVPIALTALGGVRDPDAMPAFIDASTGSQADVGEVPATAVWVGQLLAARAREDEAMCGALLCALPDDSTGHLRELLHMAALRVWMRSDT